MRPRALLLALLLSTPLLAGCLAGDEVPSSTAGEDGAAGRRPAVVPPSFLPPVELGDVELGAEPNVAVAPDGAVYVATPGALWRSDDLGQTYQPLGERSCFALPLCTGHNPGLAGLGDGSLAITRDGTVHWAGLGGGYNVPYQGSTDRGETWSEPVEVAPGEHNSTDREWITADDDGALYVVWRQSEYQESDCTYAFGICYILLADPVRTFNLNVSLDGGATWTSHVLPGDAITGPVAADPTSDAIYLPVNADGLHVLKSLDRGATWTKTTLREGIPVFGLYIFPVAAVDAAGNVYVVWAEDPDNPVPAPDLPYGYGFAVPRTAARPHVYLSVSRDGGATFSEPRLLSSGDRPAVFPWIAAGAEGRVVVAWYDAVLPNPSDRTPNAWNVAVAMSTTADAAEPVFETAFATPRPLHLGSICTSGLFCSLTAGDRSLLDFFEVNILPDGSPVLAFVGDHPVKMGMVKVYATRMTEGTPLR